MRSNSVRITIISLLVSSGITLAGCSSTAEPITTQAPIQTKTQPAQPTDTQPQLPTITQPPLPTDTQPVQPAVTQPQVTPTEVQSAISGATLLDTRCTACHSKSRVTGKHKSQPEWDQTVNRMVLKGASLTPEELMILVEYLAKTYGP